MTTYEIIATVIAGLALAQPWVIKLFVRWFRKIKITFIPSSKLKLYYNKSGSYISIGGVIEAKNQPAVIKNISAKVVRLSDKAELSMDWSSFMVPVFQSVAGNAITTNEIARPFKVEANNFGEHNQVFYLYNINKTGAIIDPVANGFTHITFE